MNLSNIIPQETVVIFGGPDNEQVEAEKLARQAGFQIAHAISTDGKKVHAGSAYQATGYEIAEGCTAENIKQAIIFECSKNAAGDLGILFCADHHNPGDAGYAMPAEQYRAGSSIGQLMNNIGISPTEHQLYIAAGDHCPADAYQGKCPGIDPEKFLEFRVQGKADFYKTNPATVDQANPELIKKAITDAQEIIRNTEIINGIYDLRNKGYIDQLPEAGLSMGIAYMTKIADTDRERKETGNDKIALGGNTTPEMVEDFMKWGNSLSNRVGNAYGNPTRGFAGIVVTRE